MTKANKIKRHPLAQRKLKAVTSSQLQAYIDFLSFGGTDPNGAQAKPIASGTVNVYMAMLHKVFKFAIYSKRILTANPMDYVVKRTKPADCDIFQNGESQDAGQVLSLEQYRILTDYLRKRGNPCLLAVQISYYAGLRLGEVLGLAWEDIDLEKQCMTICRSLSYSSSRKATSLGPSAGRKWRRPGRACGTAPCTRSIMSKGRLTATGRITTCGRLAGMRCHRRVISPSTWSVCGMTANTSANLPLQASAKTLVSRCLAWDTSTSISFATLIQVTCWQTARPPRMYKSCWGTLTFVQP